MANISPLSEKELQKIEEFFNTKTKFSVKIGTRKCYNCNGTKKVWTEEDKYTLGWGGPSGVCTNCDENGEVGKYETQLHYPLKATVDRDTMLALVKEIRESRKNEK